jgi:hypothetical protein
LQERSFVYPVRLNMNYPVPGGDHHSNPCGGGKNGQCFHSARLVGRELMPAEIALQKTRDLHLSHWTPLLNSLAYARYIWYFFLQ